MYQQINDALNRVLLGGRFESRPLYLVLDKRSRKELFQLLGGALECSEADIENECCRHVGAHLHCYGDPYDPILHAAFMWRARGRVTAPPQTALLYTLCRAAELMVSDGQFSSNNYYRRLAEVTGRRSLRFSSYGASTEKLWNSFNNWLADTDFVYGRPTARAVNAYRYVGVPMSQAIVREEDRQRFHDLFERYRFRGTDAVTQDEIAQYIGSWIHGNKPTSQLKAAWAKVELRPRICEAAIAELQEWAASTAALRSPGPAGRTRLSMAAIIRHDLLSRSIGLYLGRETELETLELQPSAGGATVTLGNSTFGSFATIEPRSSIDWQAAFLRGLALRDSEGREYGWSGRSVIPLGRSERGDYWTEVGRVTVGARHLVLARSDKRVRERVEAALEQVARPGYTVSTPRELSGLPAGWVAYEQVEVVRQLERPGQFQEPLSAVGDVGGLRISGGLKIGQSIWHRQAPPVVTLTAGSGPTALALYEGTSTEGDPLCEESSTSNELSIDVAACIPETGNVYVEARAKGAAAGTATLLLRCAARPRPIDRQLSGIVSYDGAWSTVPASTGGTLRGLALPGGDSAEASIALSSFTDLGASEAGPEIIPVELREGASRAASPIAGLAPEVVMQLPCDVRGLHVYKYETLPPDYPKSQPVNKECKDCGLHVLERRAKKVETPRQRSAARNISPPTTLKAPLEENWDTDLWFDAACFLGHGTSATFEAIVAADDVDPWRASQVLRDLSWLGHVDLAYRQGLRTRTWSVSPPVLAFTSPAQAFLAGFRDPRMLGELASAAEALGGSLSRRAISGRPELVTLEGVELPQARAALEGIADAHGRRIEIVAGPGADLARFCVARGDLATGFQPMTLALGGDVEKFDLSRMRWRRADSTVDPGAYRFSYAGTQYAFRAASGQAYLASHELAKLAAARLSGVHLHAYDEHTQVFSSFLGCEPPALLGRALVACSGHLPSIGGGIASFPGVPPEVASLVLTFLYDGEMPS